MYPFPNSSDLNTIWDSHFITTNKGTESSQKWTVLLYFMFLQGQKSYMALGKHVVCIVHGQLVLPFQMNGCILLIREPFLAHRALKPILNTTFKPHVPIKIVIPVIALSTFLALKSLFVCCNWFSLFRVCTLGLTLVWVGLGERRALRKKKSVVWRGVQPWRWGREVRGGG